jgi:signal peptidase I
MPENNKNSQEISGNIMDLRTPVTPQVPPIQQVTPPDEQSTKGFLLEIIKFTVISILVVAPIRFFIAQPFIVRGESMDPTFADGQYLIVDEITYRSHLPERGDVVVFKYPKDESKYFIKRIIGLPGETIKINNGKVSIFSTDHPEGIELNEPYIKELSFENTTETLGKDEYFAMGDNRSNSLDSRIWGPLPTRNITGRVLVRLFPFQNAGLFPGKQTQ